MANLTRQGQQKIDNFIRDEVAATIREKWRGNLTDSQQSLAQEVQIFESSQGIRVGSTNEILKFLEWGVEPHVIEPDDAEALAWTNDQGETVFATRVEHPGFEAFGHMRAAIDEARMRFKP